MIHYAMTVSDSTQGKKPNATYGLRAVNERGEELLSLPNISERREDVAYLVDRFNRVRVQRSGYSRSRSR